MTDQFKNAIIGFNKEKQKFEREKEIFKIDIRTFMKERGIPVKVYFFGDTFGLDIDLNIHNWYDVPRKISLDILSDFCKEFGCDFEYTACDGDRWIFSFNKLSIGY